MSKGLRNMQPEEKRLAVERRLQNKVHGLGFIAAHDAKKMPIPKN